MQDAILSDEYLHCRVYVRLVNDVVIYEVRDLAGELMAMSADQNYIVDVIKGEK